MGSQDWHLCYNTRRGGTEADFRQSNGLDASGGMLASGQHVCTLGQCETCSRKRGSTPNKAAHVPSVSCVLLFLMPCVFCLVRPMPRDGVQVSGVMRARRSGAAPLLLMVLLELACCQEAPLVAGKTAAVSLRPPSASIRMLV